MNNTTNKLTSKNGISVEKCTEDCFWPDRYDPGGLMHCHDKYKRLQMSLLAMRCIALKYEQGLDCYDKFAASYGEIFVDAFSRAVHTYSEFKEYFEELQNKVP